MSLPQFSAEQSLYHSGRYYATVSPGAGTAGQFTTMEGVGMQLVHPFAGAANTTRLQRLTPTVPIIGPTLGGGCPSGTICCEFDSESHTCIGGCCTSRASCCPDGAPGVGDRCTNLKTDPTNCGSCGNTCPAGHQCSDGTCAPCPVGQTLCGTKCVDLRQDTQNCGSCGNICPWSPHSTPTCVGGACSFVCDFGFNVCGNVCCSSTCTGTVTVPASGLSSNSNYAFDNGCHIIQGPYAVVQVGQDMRSDSGFTIQLNADSRGGTDVWQQYGFSVIGNSVRGFINNWANLNTAIVCDAVDLCSTPISNGLPAGYALGLYLVTDAGGAVTGAVYQVYDSNGNQLANRSFSVDQAGCNCSMPQGFSCTGFQPGDESPITAFRVVIVGPGNGAGTTFSSGAGVINYGSNGNLTPMSSAPNCVAVDFGTAETSNAAYGALNGCPKVFVAQQFSVTPQQPPPPPPDCSSIRCPTGLVCCDCTITHCTTPAECRRECLL